MSKRASGPAAEVEEKRVELPADKGVKIVALADTHGRPHPNVALLLEREAPDLILHAGDIGGTSVIRDLGRHAKVLAVRGNVDGRSPETPEAMLVQLESEGRPRLRMLLLHVAVYGPKLRSDARQLAESLGAQLVVCGHSHVPLIARDRGLLIFNPGSVGPRRFQLPITMGVMGLGEGGLSLSHLDVETGRTWLPPPIA